MPEVLFPAGQTLADGYGKGIHGKPHRNEKQLNQTHILLPLSYQIRSLHCMNGQLPDRTGLPFCGSCAVMRQPSGRIGLRDRTGLCCPLIPVPMVQQTHAGYYTMEQSEMESLAIGTNRPTVKISIIADMRLLYPHFQPSVKNSRESEKLMHNFAFLAFLSGRLVL